MSFSTCNYIHQVQKPRVSIPTGPTTIPTRVRSARAVASPLQLTGGAHTLARVPLPPRRPKSCPTSPLPRALSLPPKTAVVPDEVSPFFLLLHPILLSPSQAPTRCAQPRHAASAWPGARSRRGRRSPRPGAIPARPAPVARSGHDMAVCAAVQPRA